MRTAFAVLHSETSEQVAVDMDYHRAMFDLSQRVNPKESIVGWCAFLERLTPYRQETPDEDMTWLSWNAGTRQDQI